MAKFLNAKAVLKRARGRKRLNTNHVADAMRALFVGTNWDLVGSKVGVQGGTRVDMEMTIQHFDKTPVDHDSLNAFGAVFTEWVGQMDLVFSDRLLTIVDVAVEEDSAPKYGGRFGREGLSD